MGAPKRKPHPALIEWLLAEPAAFDFFRAVQVLEAHQTARDGRRSAKWVGHDHAPGEVGLHFGVAPSLAFPSTQIRSVSTDGPEGAEDSSYEVMVSFLGLIGPAATLPTHYTETLIQRLHLKDRALRDFLDAFHDRSAAFFYRAWKKYRLAVVYGSGDPRRGKADPILRGILALVGLLPRPRGAPITVAELSQASHAGLFSDRRRSAHGLRAMMRGLLRCEVDVEQFVGQWVDLDIDAWSRLGGGPGPGLPARLGDQSVLGARVWTVDARVRVVAGPLGRERFRRLWPGGAPVRLIWQLLRAYLGPLIECDLVWELAPDAPAALQLGGDQQLGRDGWLGWSELGQPDLRVSSPPWNISGPTDSDSRRVSA